MASAEATIKLRIDVDYPYPSRAKSFFYIALGIKKRGRKDYLRNARTIARMINESPKKIVAYWFFTPYTIPDKRLLDLLKLEKHEIGLHVATDPFKELKILESETQRKVNYYSIHGTSSRVAQILWRRHLGQTQAKIPEDFPLKSIHNFTNLSLDTERRKLGFAGAKTQAEKWIAEGDVLSIHPEWLFSEGKTRGPYYDVLKDVLDVDRDLDSIRVTKRVNVKIAHDVREYERNVAPVGMLIEKLLDRGVDIFTFLERKWCCSFPNPPSFWIRTVDNVGLLEIKDYSSWWNSVGKKTRNMVRRAEKSDITLSVVQPGDALAEGIWKIYNETPIRQERAFPHYGDSLDTVKGNMFAARNSTFIGACLGDDLVGFIQINHGDDVAVISQILALQKHLDKAVNNALLAKAVEVCADQGERWLMYGRIGNHPSLDRFKESNGFVKFPISRFYVPITRKGKMAVRLGMHRPIRDALPQSLKGPLIPVFNWLSRTRAGRRRR